MKIFDTTYRDLRKGTARSQSNEVRGSRDFRRRRPRRTLFVLFEVLALCALTTLSAFAQFSIQEEYLVPLDDPNTYEFFKVLDNPNDGIVNVISVAVPASNTILVYDHHEDGYDDLANPVQPTTRVYGDGNTANGNANTPGICSPASISASLCDGDVLDAGAVIVLRNQHASTGAGEGTISDDTTTPYVYDGRDRIGSTRSISVSRAVWVIEIGNSVGTVLADLVSLVPTSRWGTDFRMPVGQNLSATSGQMFQRVWLSVIAAEDNTEVRLNGTLRATLQKGQTTMIGQGAAVSVTIDSGDRLTTTKPVSAFLLTGDITTSSDAGPDDPGYEARFFELVPTVSLERSYCNPVWGKVGSTAQSTSLTSLWLFNPNISSINVSIVSGSGSPGGTVSIGAGATGRINVPTNTNYAVCVSSTDGNFAAIATMDSDEDPSAVGIGNSYGDWGYTLLPRNFLTREILVGFGWSSSNATGTAPNPSIDENPVWITAIGPPGQTGTLELDRDGDGTFEGSLSVSNLESFQIFDTVDNDEDQTGLRARIGEGWVLAATYGQSVDNVQNSVGGWLDMGSTIYGFKLVRVSIDKTCFDESGDGFLEPGERVRFVVPVTNLESQQVVGIVVDNIPAGLDYEPGSTKLNGAAVPDEVPGPGVLTPFPLDEEGYDISLSSGQTATFEFFAVVSDPYLYEETVINTATVTDAFGAVDEAMCEIPVLVPDFAIKKTSDAEGKLVGGQGLTYTVEVVNTSTVQQTNVSITEEEIGGIPEGTTFVGPVTVYGPGPVFFDRFGAQSYSGNDGSGSWSGSWTETGDDGLATDPIADIFVELEGADNRLFVRNASAAVGRSMNLSGLSVATLELDYRVVSGDASTDACGVVEVATSFLGSYSEVGRFCAPSGGYNHFGPVSINSVLGVSGATVRLRNLANGVEVRYDNIKIVTNAATTTGSDPTTSGGTLVSGITLEPWERVRLEFDVLVVDPIPQDLTEICNTAKVVSLQFPNGLESEVCDEVARPAIDIRKQAEGPDSRTFDFGSDVTFEIVVTNTGDVALTDVEVTDALVPNCDKVIGDLAVAGSTTYSCTATNVTEPFENIAVVNGKYTTAGGFTKTVTDEDPSTVEMGKPELSIDVTKEVASVSPIDGNGNVTVVFRIGIKNTSPVTLSEVQLVDDMQAVFGPTFVSAFISFNTPNLTPNAGYDGLSAGDTNLLTGTDDLVPDEEGVIDVTVLVRPRQAVETFVNPVEGCGKYENTKVCDDDEARVTIKEEALAVELTSFVADQVDDRIVLMWETASEKNITGFGIEQAFEDGDFSELAWVATSASPPQGASYSFDVERPSFGRHRFRLRMVYLDGSVEYSPEVEMTMELPGEVSLDAAYPNPFNPQTSIRFAVRESQPVRLLLYSMSGQILRTLYEGTPSGGITETVQIDGAELSSGTYLVRLVAGSGSEIRTITLLK